MKTVEVKCDACGSDLGDSGSMPSFRLVLSCEKRPSTSKERFAVYVEPVIAAECHFCGVGCLYRWLDERRAENPA